MDTLRSVLQPVTHNLPTPLYTLGNNLLGPSCYKHLVLDLDPANNPECFKLAVSKALGIGIIGASSIVKIPQLLKIVNSKSAAGVSFLSYLLETASFVITLAYNARSGNPFSTYGESALIAVQNVAIASLVLHYSGQKAAAAVFVAGVAGALYALFTEGVIDGAMLAKFQAGAGVLGVASKLPQVWAIYQAGNTGQLSAFAVSNLSFLGHLIIC
jgi:mannose-P-dolichol utilization defect protein 1